MRLSGRTGSLAIASVAACIALGCSSFCFGQLNWIPHPTTGHSYTLTGYGSWQDAENVALPLGGHLVTVDDAAENDWLSSTFANTGPRGEYWIGFTDAGREGHWEWSSGTGGWWEANNPASTSYTSWPVTQPDNFRGNQHYAVTHMPPSKGPAGAWDDLHYASSLNRQGIIERPFSTPNYTPPPEQPPVERLGRWNGSTFEAVARSSISSGNVHILVHGWGMGLKSVKDYPAWDSHVDGHEIWGYLAESISRRDPSSTVLMYNWLDDSATANITQPYKSLANTDNNGLRLADAIESACDLDAVETHFLGHSHGSRVAVVAAVELSKKHKPTGHLTIWDSPENFLPEVFGGSNDLHATPYLPKLRKDIRGGDTFVDNYFSFFGEAYELVDVGSGLVNVRLVPGSFSPHEYPMEWYVKANRSNSDEIGLAWSPLADDHYSGLDAHYKQDWEIFPGIFDSFRELVLKSENNTIGPNYRERHPLGYVSLFAEGSVIESDGGATLTESSPAYWHLLFETTGKEESLEFEYQFLSPGDGDQLGIWMDGELRFVITGELVGTQPMDSIIDITNLEAGEHSMTVALHSIGETGASVYVGAFNVGAFNAVAVPEPSTLVLLFMGAVGLLAYHRRTKFRGVRLDAP